MKKIFSFRPEYYYTPDIANLVSQHEFLSEFNSHIHNEEVKSERVVRIFIFASILFGCLIAYKFNTYLIALLAGSISIIVYFLGLKFFPYTIAQRLINQSILQWFILQYIFQMHGMYEMHFAYFPITTMLIVYRDLTVFLITSLIPIIQHLVCFALQLNFGYDLREYFINTDHLTGEVVFFHLLTATLHLIIVGFYCVYFRDKIAFQYQTLLKQKYTETKIIEEQQKSIKNQEILIKSYARFVPEELLRFLGKDVITEIELGDSINKNMAILFSDIRSFTSLSETMSPEDNFKFINSFMNAMSPCIRKNNGYIDKYLGDGIMAIFPDGSTDALRAGIDMLDALQNFNEKRWKSNQTVIRIGIGIHLGFQILGIIGDQQRLEGTVISDAVNTAARLEGLTKIFGTELLISEQALLSVENIQEYHQRKLGYVQVKGKSEKIAVYTVYKKHEIGNLQLAFDNFDLGLQIYENKDFYLAKQCFNKVIEVYPNDIPSLLYLKRCEEYLRTGVSENWEPFEVMTEK